MRLSPKLAAVQTLGFFLPITSHRISHLSIETFLVSLRDLLKNFRGVLPRISRFVNNLKNSFSVKRESYSPKLTLTNLLRGIALIGLIAFSVGI